MAEHHDLEPLTSAPMDYAEHQRTYDGFLLLVKYGTIVTVAILIGMLASLIGSWGVFGGLFAFAASGAILTVLLRQA
ncbi:aa3-type cytochrome c oxidase subunit IV [Aureimonas fodinaquatilis]|uniref:Aa3-type cytochrome c oxidase subunit IV n=1 Tax=Aureimonas fodinaquatilis TaxID=2565783 RepID=A0A5B0E2V4_9HYPH|nr:aa3-type cytochrome c oxidase subunit IV [Aureimonas fodinaquatilis]KAA0972281.1 aa3-type cytochrome c oxidase subunit IV [Aureimonas fodinaquatilis]